MRSIKHIGTAVVIWALLFVAFLFKAETLPKSLHDIFMFLLVGPPLFILGCFLEEFIGVSLNGVLLFFFPGLRHKYQEVEFQTRDQSFSMLRIFWAILHLILMICFFGGIIFLFHYFFPT